MILYARREQNFLSFSEYDMDGNLIHESVYNLTSHNFSSTVMTNESYTLQTDIDQYTLEELN